MREETTESSLQRYSSAYKRIIRKVAFISGVVGTITMIGLVLMTVSDVFLRYFFNRPILGSFELTEYLLIPIAMFAIPWAASEKANVRVDLIMGRIKAYKRARVDIGACLFSMILTGVLAWFTVPQALYIMEVEIVSPMLDIPAFPFYFITAFGFFILFFVLISELIDFIHEAKQQ